MRRSTFCQITGMEDGRLAGLKQRGALPFALPEDDRRAKKRIEYSFQRAVLFVAYDQLTQGGVAHETAARLVRELDRGQKLASRSRELLEDAPDRELWLFAAADAAGGFSFLHVGAIEECAELYALKAQADREVGRPAAAGHVIATNLREAMRKVLDRVAAMGGIEDELREDELARRAAYRLDAADAGASSAAGERG